jgi:hypothetical protein
MKRAGRSHGALGQLVQGLAATQVLARYRAPVRQVR